MEFILTAAALVVFVIIVYLLEYVRERKRKKEFRELIRSGYLTLNQRSYSPERFEKIKIYYQKHQKDSVVDDITWNDLGMDELFKRMNYSLSSSGEEYLYYYLRTLKTSQDELAHLEDVITFIDENPSTRIKLQYEFGKLGRIGKYSLYDYIDNLDYLGEMSNKKLILMNLIYLVLIALTFWRFSIGIISIVIFTIFKIVKYFSYKAEIDPYIVSFAYVTKLLKICDQIEKIDLGPGNRERDNISSRKKAFQSMRRFSFWVMSPMRGNSGDVISVFCDYIRMIFHVDLIKFNSMLHVVRNHTEELDSLISTVGFLESAVCIWIYRQSLQEGYCVPEFAEKSVICMTQVYHPLLTNPVKNSIDEEKNVLLTGSNASGKSTFLKTIAVNAIQAQSIHTCTAQSVTMGMFRVYSSMALRDDLLSGDSYYIVEIKALKRILDAAKGDNINVLCFVDEILRGTNTVERIAASTQILQSLGSHVFCFAATHDIELTDLLEDWFDNYHFEEEIRDNDIYFNYKLLPGKATTKNAIKLLELMGYPEEMINHATARAEYFMQSGIWEK